MFGKDVKIKLVNNGRENKVDFIFRSNTGKYGPEKAAISPRFVHSLFSIYNVFNQTKVSKQDL